MEVVFHTSFIDNPTISEIWTGLMASAFAFTGILFMMIPEVRSKAGDIILLTFGFIFLHMHIIVYITQDVLGLNSHIASLIIYGLSYLWAVFTYKKLALRSK
jgi:hypothetical protein